MVPQVWPGLALGLLIRLSAPPSGLASWRDWLAWQRLPQLWWSMARSGALRLKLRARLKPLALQGRLGAARYW